MKSKIIHAIVALLLIFPRTLHAQGTAFSYQGRLNNGAGLANGVYDFSFALYDAPSAGAQQGVPVTISALSVSNGFFTTSLDFGNQFTGANRWLEISVRTNGASLFSTLSPRQTLAPTPYSITAGNVVGAVSASQLTGPLPAASLAGTYGNALTLNNVGNSFAGNGAGLTGVNAVTLQGLGPTSLWQTTGNSGTTPGNNYLGTSDNLPFEIHANGLRCFRIEPNDIHGPNVIGGSQLNYVAAGIEGATIAGGGSGTNFYKTLFTNSVSGDFGTVGGGAANIVTNYGGTVSGGFRNTAGELSSVGGGQFNKAVGLLATVPGGDENLADGDSSTAIGGYGNHAAAEYSFAAGYKAGALHIGSFVWSDFSEDTEFDSTANNQFSVRAKGGVRLAGDVLISTDAADYHHLELNGGNSHGFLFGSYPYFGDGVHLGYNFYADANGSPHVINPGGGSSRVTAAYGEVVLAVGSVAMGPNNVRLDATLSGVTVNGTFNNNSDRNAKKDFTTVSPAQILDKVAQLPLSEWSYKTDPDTRHVGPMAQDFHAAFEIGTDDKHIAPIDEGGVALAAIQGLNQKLQEELKRRDLENAELKKNNEALEKRIEVIEQIVLKDNPSGD
ncbi:MAG TPA: tail fiber domain-containing protein [Verrucomicrobiae bacterium]|nr:tail fiber domain-containing protein [Verrucomicrobiae bacterium]